MIMLASCCDSTCCLVFLHLWGNGAPSCFPLGVFFTLFASNIQRQKVQSLFCKKKVLRLFYSKSNIFISINSQNTVFHALGFAFFWQTNFNFKMQFSHNNSLFKGNIYPSIPGLMGNFCNTQLLDKSQINCDKSHCLAQLHKWHSGFINKWFKNLFNNMKRKSNNLNTRWETKSSKSFCLDNITKVIYNVPMVNSESNYLQIGRGVPG